MQADSRDKRGNELSAAERKADREKIARRNEKQAESTPRDTQYEGHPEFSQEAAKNDPPDGMGLTKAAHPDKLPPHR